MHMLCFGAKPIYSVGYRDNILTILCDANMHHK